MDIFKNMHIFVEVARTKSFRKAADNLGMPNSTVSRRIAELERDIGLSLFDRTTRRVSLTDAGQQYFIRCEGIISDAQDAHAALLDLRSKPGGLIRISSPVATATQFVVPLLAEFRLAYPDIQLEMNLTPTVASLVDDSVDVALLSTVAQLTQLDMVARLIVRDEPGLYASPDYLQHRGMPKKPKDLLEHELLNHQNALPVPLTHSKTGRIETLEFTGSLTINLFDALRALCLEGVGICFWNQPIASPLVAENKLVRVLPQWSVPGFEIHAVTTSRHIPAKVRVFIDFLVEHLLPTDPV